MELTSDNVFYKTKQFRDALTVDARGLPNTQAQSSKAPLGHAPIAGFNTTVSEISTPADETWTLKPQIQYEEDTILSG